MPGGRTIWMPKKYGETVTLPFDFASDLDPSEIISSVVVTAGVYTGVDSNPSDIKSGSATIAGTKVNQNLRRGIVGVIYSLLCQATTSLGQILQITAYCYVEPDLP